MNKHSSPTSFPTTLSPVIAPPSWRERLPVLVTPRAVLRELRLADAPSLLPLIAVPEVARYISPPPSSVEQFAWFIEWCQRERLAGRLAAFGVVPRGQSAPVGLIQVRQLDPEFHTAEWGFVMGTASWGSGLFGEIASRVLAFAFDVLDVQRLEARAAVPNARAHAVLRRLGAQQEGVLRNALVTATGEQFDQLLWSLLANDWRAAARPASTRIH